MRKRLFQFLPALVLVMFSCVSTRDYAAAEKDLCDCLSGVKAPADEFCQEWNKAVVKEEDRLDIKMARLSIRNPEKYEVLLLKVALIKEQRDSCLARISGYQGGQ